MLEQVIEIVSDMIGVESGELPADLDLFENGLLDSFAVVQLIVELESKLGVRLAIETLSRADIATASLIAAEAEKAK